MIRGSECLSPLSVELFLSQNTKAFRGCPVLCFRTLLVSKNFMDEMGGELSRFFVETVLSHSTETFHRGTLLCFRKVLVSKKVWDKTGGAYHDSPSSIHETLSLTLREFFLGDVFWIFKKNSDGKKFNFSMIRVAERLSPLSGNFFCLRIPKYFVEHPFCVLETFWYPKVLWIFRGGNYHSFSSKLFFPTVPKLFIKELFCVSEAFWYGNISWNKGGYHNFRRKCSVSQYRISS